jgi:hypothetical protein
MFKWIGKMVKKAICGDPVAEWDSERERLIEKIRDDRKAYNNADNHSKGVLNSHQNRIKGLEKELADLRVRESEVKAEPSKDVGGVFKIIKGDVKVEADLNIIRAESIKALKELRERLELERAIKENPTASTLTL